MCHYYIASFWSDKHAKPFGKYRNIGVLLSGRTIPWKQVSSYILYQNMFIIVKVRAIPLADERFNFPCIESR